MSILKVGVIGCGFMGKTHVENLRRLGFVEVAAVAGVSPEEAQRFAAANYIPKAAANYQEILADPEIVGVHVCTPNALHAPVTKAALMAGKHVLCEKPIALTLAEVDAMASAAKETGKVLAEAFMYRHHVQTIQVKEIVDSGILGKLQLIKGAFTFKLTRQGNYRQIKEMGGGSVWDVGCYPISYARTIVGEEPVEVFGSQVEGPGGSDDSFFGQMRFASGVHAQFDSGFMSPMRAYIEVVGSDAILKIPSAFKPGKKSELYLVRGNKEEKINVSGTELYIGEVEDMCDAILLNKPPRISLADSRANIAVILGFIDSANQKKPILL